MDKEAFEIFAHLHPIEAFDLDKEMFCDFYREQAKSNKTNDEIEKLINILRR